MQPFAELDDTWARCLFNECPIPMALVSPDARFIRINDAFCALTGYGRSELLARTWQSITHPDDIAGDQSGSDAIRTDPANDVYTISKRYLSKGGEVIWINLYARAVWDADKFVCFYVVANPLHRNFPITPVQPSKPTSYLEWIKRNPKDAALLGGAAVAIFGRDAIIEVVRALIGLK